jgi:hypothetical protein
MRVPRPDPRGAGRRLDRRGDRAHRAHGSDHTEAILTRDDANAERFWREVTSSCVLVNASTRFNDGFQLGLGAEIGISTSRVHWYGPDGPRGADHATVCGSFRVAWQNDKGEIEVNRGYRVEYTTASALTRAGCGSTRR